MADTEFKKLAEARKKIADLREDVQRLNALLEIQQLQEKQRAAATSQSAPPAEVPPDSQPSLLSLETSTKSDPPPRPSA